MASQIAASPSTEVCNYGWVIYILVAISVSCSQSNPIVHELTAHIISRTSSPSSTCLQRSASWFIENPALSKLPKPFHLGWNLRSCISQICDRPQSPVSTSKYVARLYRFSTEVTDSPSSFLKFPKGAANPVKTISNLFGRCCVPLRRFKTTPYKSAA